jgi:cytochrome P450
MSMRWLTKTAQCAIFWILQENAMADANVPTDRDLVRCPLHEIDPLDPVVNQTPHAYFRRLRDEAPVFRDAMLGIVHVSRYEDVLKVISQPAIFSSEFGALTGEHMGIEMLPEEKQLMADERARIPTLLTRDPPAHTRYKKLAMKGFTYKRVQQMGPYIEQVVNQLIDGFIGSGACEFKTAFADNLPSILIADAVAVDRTMLPQWHIWLRNAVRRFDLKSMSDAERISSARVAKQMYDFLRAQIAAKRAQPGDDIISDLVSATLVEEGDARPLSEFELISIFAQVFVAGQETTANTLTAGLYYLLTNPGQMAQLRADPELMPGFVEEALRFLTPVNNMFRRVKQDTELGGVALKAGDMMMVKYGSANHDERHFPDPERFDITRANAREHLAFGRGIHHCLGSELARRQINTAFRILLRRLVNIRLATDAGPIRYLPNHLLRGVAELRIEFDQA